MKGRVLTVAICLFMISFTPIFLQASAQLSIIPSITLECFEDSVEIGIDAAFVTCEIENPTQYVEKVELTSESDINLVHPEEITVGPEESQQFMVAIDSSSALIFGNYDANISARVVEANDLAVSLITSTESDSFIIKIAETLDCEVTMGQGGGEIQAGEIVIFSATYRCDGNRDGVKVIAHLELFEHGGNSPHWPAGYIDKSPPCDLTINNGDGVASCQFTLETPDEISSEWKGCMIILDNTVRTSDSCNQNTKLQLTVKPKSTGLGIELGGNNSIIDQLGLTKEQLPIIGGGIGLVLFIIIGLVVFGRKNRDDEYER
tara:strand:+ start:97 stop:1053 length:957 start_codon:yes stop_codon:yes gene_type:complete